MDIGGLLRRATDIRPLIASDGKSGGELQLAAIDGESRVIKRTAYAHDWLMQAIGDTAGAAARAWNAGLMDRLPDCIDHATIAMECEETADGIVVTSVMRDVSADLVPDGDEPISPDQELRFLQHMAALHAALWGWRDDIGLISLTDRYSLMTRDRITRAGAASPDAPVPPLILDGWSQLPSRAPAMAETLFALHDDVSPLVDALAGTPVAFIHGDWKMANLGTRPDGCTVLVDWSFPGSAPPCAELAHYMALNRRRMARSKPDAAAAYRAALEAAGIDTSPWWDRQFALALLGIMCALGWEKALGDEDELAWWAARVEEGAALL